MPEARKPFFGRIRASLLFRVVVVYFGASWIVLEIVDTFGEQFGLPTWFFPAALALLLIGLPIILGTAMVQAGLKEGPSSLPLPDFEIAGGPGLEPTPGLAGARTIADHPLSKWLTWKRSILGGVLAFAALATLGTYVVVKGSARVTEAYGVAGEDFGERAWLVVADIAAPTGEPDVGIAVREALTVDLQQSKYVNVFTRSQMDGVLGLMEVGDTIVDEELARQIAQREGLAAVFTGSVSKLGDNYVLAARVLRPDDGEELIAVRSTAAPDNLVNAVEALSREIRARLGESRSAISDSRPLPQVTTRSLGALQRYAQAVATLASGKPERALDLAEAAIALDPEFAMAHRLAGVVHNNQSRMAQGQRYTIRAYELRHKLTERERLHIEARYASTVLEDPLEAMAKYELILSAYPDDARAANNLASNANQVGDYERAHRWALRAVELNPYLVASYYNAVVPATQRGDWAVADSLIKLAFDNGLQDWAIRAKGWWIDVAEGDWTRVAAVCDSLITHTPAQSSWRPYDGAFCGGLDGARGRIEQGVQRAQQGADDFADLEQHTLQYLSIFLAVQSDVIRGRSAEARDRLATVLAQQPLDSIPRPDWFDAVYWAATAAAHSGDLDLAEDLATRHAADTARWDHAAQSLRLRAAIALAKGQYRDVLDFDRRGMARAFDRTIVYDQIYRAQAFDGLEQWDSATALYEDIVDPHSLADLVTADAATYAIYLPIAHRRLGEIYAQLGEPAKAAEHYEAFIELWEYCDPELQPQVDAARRALQRLAAERSAS